MTQPINIYTIWYGNWQNNPATSIISNFISNLGGSSYWGINTAYYMFIEGTKTYVSDQVTLKGSFNDNYSQGTSITQSLIEDKIIPNAVSNGLTLDVNGIYLILMSKDIKFPSYCLNWCAKSFHSTISGATIKYSVIGDPETQCPRLCAYQETTPNGNLAADTMINLIANSLANVATDPLSMSWWDSHGNQNADKCNFNFGTSTFKTTNGAIANLTLNGKNYLVQQLWNLNKGACSMS